MNARASFITAQRSECKRGPHYSAFEIFPKKSSCFETLKRSKGPLTVGRGGKIL